MVTQMGLNPFSVSTFVLLLTLCYTLTVTQTQTSSVDRPLIASYSSKFVEISLRQHSHQIQNFLGITDLNQIEVINSAVN